MSPTGPGPTGPVHRSAPAEFFAGAGLLARGLGLLVRRPRLFALGALPPAIASVLFITVVIVLASHLTVIADWLTPFADSWSAGLAELVRVLVGLGVLAGSILVMVLTFTTVTLALGSPLYDLISESVDAELPAAPPSLDEPLRTGLARALRQSAALIAVSAVGAVALLALGVVPVVGSIVAAVGSATFGGWMLCIELVGSALERRRVLTIGGRRRLLRGRRARVLGLGVPTFLLLSIPFVGIVVFPAATAAGTLLARQLLDEPSAPAPAQAPRG